MPASHEGSDFLMLGKVLGLSAAVLTTASYIPQLTKAWRSGESDDVSLRMLLILLAGLALWIAYGFVQGDPVIVIANSVSALLLSAIIVLKFRNQHG